MIAPEVRRGGNGETGRLILLRNNLLVSALIFSLLQLWRPFFFLTDDNLDGGLPFFTEMGRHLLSGRLPFFSDYLFDGHYNLLRDPIFFCWHPLYLLVSLLSGTPLHHWIIDVDAFVFVMLSTAGFVNLAWYLRRDLALTVSDGWLMFYTMSFTYSMIVLTTGASWLNFLGNQSAMPWLAWGILHRSRRRGMALVALFSLHQLLGGHIEPMISDSFLFTLFAAGVSRARRSWVPLASWIIGSVIAVVFVLPLLIPALDGFVDSYRSRGVDLVEMQKNNIPGMVFPTSFFLGVVLWFVHPPATNFTETYMLALGGCAAAWCFIPAVAGQTKWSRLELLIFGMLALIAVLIIRPIWISEVMIQLPLLKSMRWPFREFLQFQFFLHLFLLIRRPGFTRRVRVLFALLGLSLFVPPLFIHAPPTFSHMDEDRQLLFSGAFDRYWAQVRPLLHPGDRIAVIIPPKLFLNEDLEKPYSLLGTFNYACMGRFVNIWGWSQTPPEDQYFVRTLPQYVFGAYTPAQRASLLAERPALRFITLESLQPLKITLSSGTGPTIDLTPFAPAHPEVPRPPVPRLPWMRPETPAPDNP
jgi:hypothetical protein